ncbi:MAG: DEAD/DEAH box helicase [Thermoproteota archaeon]
MIEAEVREILVGPVKAVLEEAGLIPLTDPQIKAIPEIMKGSNVLLVAPTGTGKTEAALLPIFSKLLQAKDHLKPGIKVVYITPLRSLNRDLLDRLAWWGSKLDISVAVRHGDTDQRERSSQAASPPDLIVTTPETLQIILTGRLLRQALRSVRWVVVDEIHELASDKRGSQLSVGLERLRRLATDEIQTIGLSATVGKPEELARYMVGEDRSFSVIEVPVPREMEVKVELPKPTSEDLLLAEKISAHPEVAARIRKIVDLIAGHKAVLLFTNTRATAETLGNKFMMLGLDTPIKVHHGSLGKQTRMAAESGLKSGGLRGVICTSSLELGIDVGLVDLVIQYGSPREAVRLVQRVGRSGHKIGWTAKGVIVAIDSDDFLESTVIKARALSGLLEPVQPPPKPYDVLAHQLAGLLLERGRWNYEDALAFLRSSAVYSDLQEKEFLDVLEFLSSKLIPPVVNDQRVSRMFTRPRKIRSLYEYYFNNLSTIPDVKQYAVIDETNSEIVGMLDEEFVAEKGVVGIKFVMAGRVWNLTQVYEGKVFVKPADDAVGAVPFWVGEEIPVPFEVAQQVGALRFSAASFLKEGKSLSEASKLLSKKLGVSPDALEVALTELFETVAAGLPVPSDRVITVESWGEFVIIQCCFGDKVNRTLARLLGTLISNDIGATIQVDHDPYRILARCRIPADVAASYLIKLANIDIESALRIGVENLGLFRRRLMHVAKRFGVIEKDADLSSVSLIQTAKALEGTVVYEEALKELINIDYDVVKTKEVLKLISSRSILIDVINDRTEPAPLARPALFEVGRKIDLISPEKAQKTILGFARVRLLNEELVLFCTNCKKYVVRLPVRKIQKPLQCLECGSENIGVLPSEEDARTIRYRPGLRRSRTMLNKAMRSSALLLKYGQDAAMVLAGRGITIRMAEKILSEKNETGQDLVALIVEAEKRSMSRIWADRKA